MTRYISLAAVLVAMVVTVTTLSVPDSARGSAGTISVPDPGRLAVGVSGFSDPESLAASLPFEVESISFFDVSEQAFRVYVPGAPATVNANGGAEITEDTIVWVRRRPDAGQIAPLSSGAAGNIASASFPSGFASPSVLPAPAPGGLTYGLAGTSALDDLLAAQQFDVEAILVADPARSRFRVFIPGAPLSVNTLTNDHLDPSSVVWVRRAENDLINPASVGLRSAAPPPASTSAPVAAPGPAAGGTVFAAPAPPPAVVPAPAAVTATASPTPTPTASPTPSPTPAPTASPTPSPTASPTPSPTPAPTASPTPAPTATPPAPPAPGVLVRHVTYEPGENQSESPHTATADGLTTTTEAARRGSGAGVALLEAGTPQWKGNVGYRSEWHGVDTVALGVERWHGISYYLPSDWHQGQNSTWNARIVYQFHTSGGPGWSPIYGLLVKGDASNPKWAFYRKDRYTKNDGSVSYKNTILWEQPAVVGEWIDFVVHAKWTADDSGYIEFYRNRQQVYSASGLRTMSSSEATVGPYSKWGIYGQPTRILFDEVRIAEGANQLDAVSP